MRYAPILAAVAVFAASPATAKDIAVKMMTSGPSGTMVFEPAFVHANVGDTVHFVASPSHNAETIPDMLPAGVAPTAGGMNKEFLLKLSKPGLYGVRCKPHFAMGMVALIEAGKAPANLAAARAAKLPGLASKRMTALLAQVK